MAARTWKKLSTSYPFKNKWMRLREDKVITPGGKKGVYSVVEREDAVGIIAQDNKGQLFLVREFRYPIQQTLWQLPAGHKEKNRTPLQSAQKELKEELWLTAKKWEKLGGFYIHSGLETTYLHVFLARELNGNHTLLHQEDDEMIQHIEKVSLSKLKKMIAQNKIECGWSLAALNLFLLHSQK